MAKFELKCTEVDGLLYLNIKIDEKTELDNLGKYGAFRLNYLHEQKPDLYTEILLTGKLSEYCT